MTEPPKPDRDDEALEDFFKAGRADAPDLGPDLMARILADAAAQQPAPVPAAGTLQGTPRGRGGFGWFADLIGGWPAMGGLAAATVAGVWIGAAPPAALEDMATGVLGSTVAVELFPYDSLLAEDG